MKRLASRFSVCAEPVFVVSLVLLVANDFYLKSAFPGWLTGKLSDFAGLVVFSLLLFSLWPRRIRVLAWGIAAAFAYWKSPLSGPAIDAFNEWSPLGIGRVVDYTDLAALAVIPAALRFFTARTARRLGSSWRTLLVAPSAAVAFFAVTATSFVPYTRVFVIQGIETRESVSVTDIERVLGSVAGRETLECEPIVATDEGGPRRCRVDNIWLTFSVDGGRASFRIQSAGNSRRRIRKTDDLVDDIKREFTDHFDGLEYVEPLLSPLERARAVE